jgi:hypothetical protein
MGHQTLIKMNYVAVDLNAGFLLENVVGTTILHAIIKPLMSVEKLERN